MNVNFDLALRYIDGEEYEKAIEYLNKAIDAEISKNDMSTATEYKCVLGELYARLGMEDESAEQFEDVLDYCDEHHILPKQRHIAKTYLNAFDGILPPAPEAPKKAERPGYIPLVPKPVQDKGFITKQMSKKHR